MEGREFSYKDAETTEAVFQKRRRCFCFPCFGSSIRGGGVGLRWWHKGSAEVEETSFLSSGIGALKKLREWSEIVAGPRWKTFIRRFNRSKSGGRQGKFQYDPLSYSLNFDHGPVPNEEDDEENEYIYRNFSTRYASVPGASGKASMDLGKDGPSFV